MARPYQLLRELLRQNGISNEILALELGEHATTISRKLNCRNDWTCTQMWKIMDLINQPSHRFGEIFPANGQNEPTTKRRIYRRAV